jgi:hypothetical protein
MDGEQTSAGIYPARLTVALRKSGTRRITSVWTARISRMIAPLARMKYYSARLANRDIS